MIPAKNAGEEFALTLEVIPSQADIEPEIIVVDSGSTDSTVALARRFGARVFEVPPESFDHGRTRNLGLSKASGEFCVLLSQDAVPVGETWLSKLLEPFSDSHVAGSRRSQSWRRTRTEPFATGSSLFRIASRTSEPPEKWGPPCIAGNDEELEMVVPSVQFSRVDRPHREPVRSKE